MRVRPQICSSDEHDWCQGVEFGRPYFVNGASQVLIPDPVHHFRKLEYRTQVYPSIRGQSRQHLERGDRSPHSVDLGPRRMQIGQLSRLGQLLRGRNQPCSPCRRWNDMGYRTQWPLSSPKCRGRVCVGAEEEFTHDHVLKSLPREASGREQR